MNQLIEKAKELLESGTVAYIIGYTKVKGNQTIPFIARTASEAEKLTFDHFALNNLAVYLTKLDKPKSGKIGIIVKGCDARAVVMLIQESQVKREDLYIIAMNCNGVTRESGMEWKPDNLAPKCMLCMVRTPSVYDALIGEIEDMPKPTMTPENMIEKLESLPSTERWDFWQSAFENCIKCYACRQACPMCYCEQCIVDKNIPQWIESSPSKQGNLSWNLIRAFHQSGRCIGCGECARVCPMNIPINLLNMKMGMIAMSEFNYRPGMDLNEATLVGTYSLSDKEDFIK